MAQIGLLVLVGFALLLLAPTTRADILISPQRAILTDNARQTVISLHNPGTLPRAYRLSWVERRLTEDGQVISLKDGENPNSIAAFVRFSPRRVTVGPGQTQTIRLDYRPPTNLKPGEYRSHLRIGTEPLAETDSPKKNTEESNKQPEGISFRIEALMSFSIPVFVRHGTGDAEVKIAAVEPILVQQHGGAKSSALKITLSRTGAFSSYGRLAIYQQLNANAPVELIGEVESVAVYAELNNYSRVVNLNPEKPLLPGSWVRIVYEGLGEERGQILAEQTFQIGN